MSVRGALTLSEALEAAADRLETYPRLGRIVPEFADPSIREVIVREYRMLYRLADEDVWIVVVLHGSRDLLRHLPAGPWDIQ